MCTPTSTVHGRGDHAGATPMDFRLDPGLPLADSILELERLVRAAGKGTVGTIGEIEVHPSLINVIPERVRFSLDIRGVDEEVYGGVARDIATFVQHAAKQRADDGRGARAPDPRADAASTPRIVAALEEAARSTGEPFMLMASGAAHDTMCVADHVPCAMVFVPCRDGVSHSPLEDADPADAALAADIILNAIRALV